MTSFFVYKSGPEIEANPIMRSIFENYGITTFVLLKLVVLAFFMSIPERIPEAKWIRYVYIAVNLLLTYVMINSFAILTHMFGILA